MHKIYYPGPNPMIIEKYTFHKGMNQLSDEDYDHLMLNPTFTKIVEGGIFSHVEEPAEGEGEGEGEGEATLESENTLRKKRIRQQNPDESSNPMQPMQPMHPEHHVEHHQHESKDHKEIRDLEDFEKMEREKMEKHDRDVEKNKKHKRYE